MSLGAPRVSLAALADLNDLLIRRGFRRSSSGDTIVAEEEQDERDHVAGVDRAATPAVQHDSEIGRIASAANVAGEGCCLRAREGMVRRRRR
jgi:hypothetical protein